jgi:hypothetical protein
MLFCIPLSHFSVTPTFLSYTHISQLHPHFSVTPTFLSYTHISQLHPHFLVGNIFDIFVVYFLHSLEKMENKGAILNIFMC